MSKLSKEEKKAKKEAKKAEKATKKKHEKYLDTLLNSFEKGVKFVAEVSYLNNLRKFRKTCARGNMIFVQANKRLYMWTGKRFLNITEE